VKKNSPLKKILITGGTGSFGKAFIDYLIKKEPNIERLVIYSRDELKQYEMNLIFSEEKYKFLRYFLGDVRDVERLSRAMENIDTVVHAAALKQVVAEERNPFEYIKTNIVGAQNVINAAISANVKNVVALSTDKASSPINLYGATKLCSDKLFVASNNVKGSRPIKFSIVRYGNVMFSRGSVIPHFLEKKKSGQLPITDPRMTRFNITLQESVEMVDWVIKNSLGGEIFVPKIPSYKVIDLAEAICQNCEKKIIGLRPGEKIHEEMISNQDALYTVDLGKYFAILPQLSDFNIKQYCKLQNGVPVSHNFSYNSQTNKEFLDVEEIRELISKNLPSSLVDI